MPACQLNSMCFCWEVGLFPLLPAALLRIHRLNSFSHQLSCWIGNQATVFKARWYRELLLLHLSDVQQRLERMLLLRCSPSPAISIQAFSASGRRSLCVEKSKISPFSFKRSNSDAICHLGAGSESKPVSYWSFLGGSRVLVQSLRPKPITLCKKSNKTVASCNLTDIASNAFTLGTVAVLPFYTLMVLAPNAELTKRTMQSSLPYVILGLLYAYLLYLSWTPDTIRLMFASKYWLPELPGIARMFSNEMTLASAWIHLLVVDLFAARQIFQDGLKNGIETRHSVSLCLLFCPVGIATHALTKLITKRNNCEV